jgi:hypothetical protein
MFLKRFNRGGGKLAGASKWSAGAHRRILSFPYLKAEKSASKLEADLNLPLI